MEAQPSAPGGAVPVLPRRSWIGVVVLTVLVAIPAGILGPVIWPPDMSGTPPTPGQLPFLIFEQFFEALALGVGVSFLVFGLPLVRRATPDLKARAWLMYLSIGWSLVSWWPHGNLHMSNGDNMQRLLYIEYGFHVTLINRSGHPGLLLVEPLEGERQGEERPLGKSALS